MHYSMRVTEMTDLNHTCHCPRVLTDDIQQQPTAVLHSGLQRDVVCAPTFQLWVVERHAMLPTNHH